ncbi:hypothetical protein BDFB_013789, partial [Asbolus verrucosus]
TCNDNSLFRCDETVNPLALEESRFFHPSKDRWQTVPNRPTAWRLKPNSYIWVPSMQLFPDAKIRPFPREFALFVTLRVQNKEDNTKSEDDHHGRIENFKSGETTGGS